MDTTLESMKSAAIQIAAGRLGHPLPTDLMDKIRSERWSCLGLEMIIDNLKTIEVSEIENYLKALE